MKQYKIWGTLLLASGFFMVTTIAHAEQVVKGTGMYRLYNKNSGEHFYTKNAKEKANLVKVGWKDEGTGWYAPNTGKPVYRMYNKNAGDHHYTLSAEEKDSLVKVGWKYEGIGWYSAEDNGKQEKLYRAYNPNAKAGSHNYTTNDTEQSNLIRAGWRDEGYAWNGLKPLPPVIDGLEHTKYIAKQKGKYDALKNIKAYDFLGNPLKIKVTGSVDLTNSSTYELTYLVVDSLGQRTVEKASVSVGYLSEPTINGADYTSIKQSFTEFDALKGVSAVDGNGNELKVTVSGKVNPSVPNAYYLIYSAVDQFGTKKTIERQVEVQAYDSPTILGLTTLNLSASNPKAIDLMADVSAVGGNGKAVKVSYTGEYDAHKSGSYSLTYTAIDEFGNKSQSYRFINVGD